MFYTMYSLSTSLFPKKIGKKLLPYKETLSFLASPDVSYETKKRILVQESGGFV